MSVRRTYLNLMKPFSARETSFTVLSYDEISKSGCKNFVFSPFAAETLLALAYLGAREDTAEQFRVALAYKPSSQDKTEDAFKKVLDTLQEQAPVFLMYNFLFVANNHELRAEFKKTCENFRAFILPINFSNPAEVKKKMNLHVKNTTEADAIEDLIEDKHISETTKVILSTFTKFKGFWNSEFDIHLNVHMRFYEEARKPSVYVPGCLKYWFYYYLEHPGLDCRFLEIDFFGRDMALTIVLPNKINGLAALESQIDLVVRADHPMQKEQISLHIPKFKIENKIDYKDILKKMCVEKAFADGEADFTGIAGLVGDLCIDEILQQSVVDIGETGCNTKGLTCPINGTDLSEYDNVKEKRVEFKVDHPFLFYIRVKDLVLYVGRVVSLEEDEVWAESF